MSLLPLYRHKITQNYLSDESQVIEQLLTYLDDYDSEAIRHQAIEIITAIRKLNNQQTLMATFLLEYQLNSDEGIVLMGIAEALLRIPDSATQDLFLKEKLTEADWHKHLHHSDSLLVNFATQALEMTGKFENILNLSDDQHQLTFSRLCERLGFPVMRIAIRQAMQQLAYQFVIAESIEAALKKAKKNPHNNILYSFDMLGEAALTEADAEKYFTAYSDAISHLATQALNKNIFQNPSLSIKLSALYPRYESLQHKQAIPQISKKLLYLCQQARNANISVTIDAEESDRLEMSLDIFSCVLRDDSLHQWGGFGIAVQAYQKRAIMVLNWLVCLAKTIKCKIPVRLVKGAYWDNEIKNAQVNGWTDYPVFTHKSATDISYLACCQFILRNADQLYAQFATHNAHTVAAIQQMAAPDCAFEFQRLHGMGENLFDYVANQTDKPIPCRIYAPVGRYWELLPYLIRRLLENGANTSFINQLENPEFEIAKLTVDPLKQITSVLPSLPCYPLPKNIFSHKRINSFGYNLADIKTQNQIKQALEAFKDTTWQATPVVNGEYCAGKKHKVNNPANINQLVGEVTYSEVADIKRAIDIASLAFKTWRLSPVIERAVMLQNTANLLEKHSMELVSLCVKEAGKTIPDSLSEIREAVDFCRYYAQQAVENFSQPQLLQGVTGENNQLYQYGRGVFVCISPWNFPIAIFIGQIAAALVSGNTVIAKPASETALTAMCCIDLLYEAGFPKQVLQFLPGPGANMSQHLLSDMRIAGVAFTGSTFVAHDINRQLSKRQDIVPIIAETGGQNVMIADNSAYSEQLVKDVVQSAFNSAGQRCSALRVLFLPNEIADDIIARIIQRMQLLIVTNPDLMTTDIGPVINQDAMTRLTQHVNAMQSEAKSVFQLSLGNQQTQAYFFPPTLIELDSFTQLTEEHFGPVLHIVRYNTTELDQLIESVNQCGYGLTLGIHSRINHSIKQIVSHCKVGNIYINRNMISAVVGVQPFGGMGLSGTGPKAGGPHYLQRFAVEQTVTRNTTAIGGNVGLLTKNN